MTGYIVWIMPTLTTLPAPAAPRVCALGCCIDGLETVRSEDGPVEYACLRPCCKQTREDARAERTARAATTTAFDRLPAANDEEF